MLVNIYVKITQKAESMKETSEVAPFVHDWPYTRPVSIRRILS